MFKRFLLFPVLALFSRRFYLSVLFKFRGIGLSYLIGLSVLCSIVLTIFLYIQLLSFQENELKNYLSQMPSLIVNSADQFEFAPNQPSEVKFYQDEEMVKYAYIATPKGTPLILFNPLQAKVPGKLMPLPEDRTQTLGIYMAVFTDHITVYNGPLKQVYYVKDLNLQQNRLITSQMVSEGIGSFIKVMGPALLFVCLFVFGLIRQVVNVCVTTLFVFILSIIMKIRMPMPVLIRLTVFANTAPTILGMLAIFFFTINPSIFNALNSSVIGFIPLIYAFFALKDARDNLIDRFNKDGGDSDDNGMFSA